MLVTFRLVVLGYLHFQNCFSFYYGGSQGGGEIMDRCKDLCREIPGNR